MRRLLLIVALIPGIASSASIDLEMDLLKEKASLCLASIQEKQCGSTGHCEDFDSYSDYVFKGSATSYVNYHIQAGNMHKGNSDLVLSALQADVDAKKAISAAPKCN